MLACGSLHSWCLGGLLGLGYYSNVSSLVLGSETRRSATETMFGSM